MKCEKCNDKEATFYYSCNINGNKSERHLCPDCARAEGFGELMEERSFGFDEMFDGFFDDFFAPRRSFFSPFDMFGSTVRRMMAPTLPKFRLVIGEPAAAQQTEQTTEAGTVPADAGAEVKTRREIAALKHQLHEAVRAEDFEKAIELRDRLKELEKKD